MQYQTLTSLAIALAGLSACQTNETGHLAALKTGTILQPAQRGSPLEPLRAACGDGAATPAGELALRRHPYLQQVTASSAMLGWVSAAPGAARVEVTTADHQPVASRAAELEPNALRGSDAAQLWARVDGLSPDTIYCYSVWRGDEQLTSPTSFRTAPDASTTRPIRFLAFGDSGGGGSDQYALRDQMLTVPYELMVHTGDLAYGSGTLPQLDGNLFRVYSDLLRNLPLFPVAGNHEYDTLGGAPFREVFALPGDSGERWYSFDWGRAHFAAFDTESDHAAQAGWLDRDLATTALPWKIVYLHRPPYSSGGHGSDSGLRALLAPILERHRVELVLAGHDHDYERTEPQRGVTYVVTGGGGVGTTGVGSSSFTAFSEDVIHFVYAELDRDELRLHAIDATGAEFDSVAIAR